MIHPILAAQMLSAWQIVAIGIAAFLVLLGFGLLAALASGDSVWPFNK